MDAKTLMHIVETRIKSSDGNPTSNSFLYEVYKALRRLNAYESKEKLTFSEMSEKDVIELLEF